MNDFEKLINASDLIEWIMETYPDWCVGAVRSIVDHVEALPSAQRTGRWIFETLDGTPGYRPTVMFCSKCGRVSIADYSYCPNCGAKMKEGDTE